MNTRNSSDPIAELRGTGRVCVIGCSGRMGGMLMREGRGGELGMVGQDQPLIEGALKANLAHAKIALVCVPAAVFSQVLEEISPFLPRDCILCDITSVKVKPLAQMAKSWKGDVVGTHPLFGPLPDHSGDLPVAITPGPNCSEHAVNLVRAMFEAMRFSTFECSAEQHDRAMAHIQTLNFITTLAYFARISNDEEILPFITPSFRRRLAAAKKMMTEDGRMFAGLFEANPYSQEAVRSFSKFLSIASGGDIDLLLDRASWWWTQGGVK